MENVVLSVTGMKPRTRRISVGVTPPHMPRGKPPMQNAEENETPKFQRARRKTAFSSISDAMGKKYLF